MLTFLAGAFFLACAGCGKSSVAVAEGKERNSALYRKALDAERGGDVKGAIALYRTLLIEEPRAYSVHMQLATLLQDYEENYIAALYHYQQYIILRPESDKASMAQDRIRLCEQFLAPQILRKVGDTVEGLTQAHLLKENDRLNRLIVQLQGEKTSLAEATERANKERIAATNETARLRELLDRMRVTDTAGKPPVTLPKKSDAATKPIERPDANALKALRDEAAALAAEGSRAAAADLPKRNATAEDVLKTAQQKVTGNAAAAQTQDLPPPPSPAAEKEMPKETPPATITALLRGAEKMDKAKETPKPAAEQRRTHVVQPGETLYGIAEKYYGDSTHWKKIRDANKAQIDPNWRVRAGQTLVIP